jgi:hypothetical protein
VDVIEHIELQTITMHEYIKTDSGLDEDEIDGIMLSVLSGQPFVTNDSQAIEFFNEVHNHCSAGKAQGFEVFLDDFLGNGYIDRAEHRLLLEEKTK